MVVSSESDLDLLGRQEVDLGPARPRGARDSADAQGIIGVGGDPLRRYPAGMTEPEFPPPTATPVPFFIPAASSPEMAEEAWQGMRRMVDFPTTDRRVQRLQYNNHRGVFTSEVGCLENDDDSDWLTTAIFEPSDPSHPWMISIMRFESGEPQWRNPPILVGQSDILEVTDFLGV